jgi:hypothetical protein
VGLDALYGVLGLILGFNAWNERRALVGAQEARSKGLQQEQQQEQQEQQQQQQPGGNQSGQRSQ